MASTNFIPGTVITSEWLNEVDEAIFETVPELQEQLDDVAIFVNHLGADNTGVIEATSTIQGAINTCAAFPTGGRVILRGTYLVDTISLKSKVTLDLEGAKLNFVAHTSSHNPVIRIGDVSSAVSGAKVIGGEIDGNASNQTYSSEEWSPGIFIWGSTDNEIRGVKIHNCRGDNITIGYDSGRVVGSNRNLVENCELYDPNVSPSRMCVAITYGNENRIIKNKCSGVIDLELNVSVGECKNNLVFGNTGRISSESLTAPRISDLVISLASLNTDPLRYYGNVVEGNHCCFISMQYNKKSTIANNVVVGSISSQARLIDISGCDDTIITANQFDANAAVATSIVDILRTRGCSVLTVTNNQIRGDVVSSRPFHNFINTFASSTASDHFFFGNQTESGWYRNSSCQQPTERARFRINQDPSGSLTVTQVSGVKCYFGISRSATNAVLTQVGNAGAQYLVMVDPLCNATTSGASNMTHLGVYTLSMSGSNRTLAAYTFVPATGTVSLSAFSFASGGGTGTFFIDVLF